jgi:hypothetical protein
MTIIDRFLAQARDTADVQQMTYVGGNFTAVWHYPAVVELITGALGLLKDAGAVNLLTFAANHPEHGRVEIGICRTGQLTPAHILLGLTQQVQQMQTERDQLRAAIERLVEIVRRDYYDEDLAAEQNAGAKRALDTAVDVLLATDLRPGGRHG